jgi:hypothetical protein
MGRALRLGGLLLAAVLFASIWQGDVAAQSVDADLQTTSVAEPVVESPVQPAPGGETPQKNPFEPYGIGPPEEAIPIEALGLDEQDVAARGVDTASWTTTHDAFAAAVDERSKRARAEAAQHQLGVDSLDTVGVVP